MKMTSLYVFRSLEKCGYCSLFMPISWIPIVPFLWTNRIFPVEFQYYFQQVVVSRSIAVIIYYITNHVDTLIPNGRQQQLRTQLFRWLVDLWASVKLFHASWRFESNSRHRNFDNFAIEMKDTAHHFCARWNHQQLRQRRRKHFYNSHWRQQQNLR